jgi:hypothetical protein
MPPYRFDLATPADDADLRRVLAETPMPGWVSADVQVLPSRGGSGWGVFERRGLARGQKAGDIKPAALDPWPGWAEEFAPLSARPAGAP